MRMTLEEALESLARGETPEQYAKRMKRIRQLGLERDALEDAIAILAGDPAYAEKLAKKQKRLETVNAEIERLK